MQQHWTLLPPAMPTAQLITAVGGHPLIAQLLAQRGFDTPEKARAFLDPNFYAPTPPTALTGVVEAAQLLHEAMLAEQNILVWGDFDVDGQTSTSLLVAALQKLMGIDRVRFHVPNRFTESHGIRVEKLTEKLADDTFAPDLLLSCDTGIADAEGVTLAKQAGLTVVITDHHDLTAEFAKLTPGRDPLWGLYDPQLATRPHPPASVRYADAIVNPKFQPADDPLRTLPGVGVAYKLVQQLYTLCGRAGEERELLDLVALGIVADVAEQVNDARYLLQLGLERLRKTKRFGLLALMEVARLNPETVDADSIGFQLGPRMNALGRLEDATVAVELLTTRDVMRASQLAGKMERLNQQRRVLTSQITAAAMDLIDRDPKLLDYNALVLAHPNWHAGIVGIVASRLVEEFGKPTVLLLTPPGEPARGSARSVPGVDIGGAIAACGHLLLHFGGHPGAAGMSLLPENVDRFRRELDRQIELHRDESIPTGLTIDVEAPLAQVSLTLAEELQRLAPFGNGNPTPQFLTHALTVVEDRRLGREGTHRRLTVQSADGAKAPVIWFNGADVELPTGAVDLVYTVGINEYRGERNLQLSFVAVRPAQHVGAATLPHFGPQWRIEDLRDQQLTPAQLPSPEQAHWYAEGVQLATATAPSADAISYTPRLSLANAAPGQPLVLYSIPPSMELLQWLVESTAPSVIYLCGQQTTDDTLSGLLRSVAGMCKYALQRDGLLQLDRMAARLGMTEAVIRHSLLWLESRGQIALLGWDPSGAPADTVQIAPGDGQEKGEDRAILQAELDEQLAEVRAYRRFFLRAKIKELGL
ncbi:MAG: DHHA1 domain-containing protein [Caldilineaceae bacterium]